MSANHVEATFRFWYDDEQGVIKIATRDGIELITTVNRDPQNMRGHPNLYNKLAKCLHETGKPAPE